MPTTRAARRAAAERQFIELPADVLSLVLYQLPLAHDIALTGLTCRALCAAATRALKDRPFSSKVVTLRSHDQNTGLVVRAAVAPDGRVIITRDKTVVVWSADLLCGRGIQTGSVSAVAVLPGGARFISCGGGNAKLWTLDGDRVALERTFDVYPVGSAFNTVYCIAALPDGLHFVVGLYNSEVRLYHVDGTLVRIFKGHADQVHAVAVTPDGQHIISGSDDNLVKVWSVASESLVSTCTGHAGTANTVVLKADGTLDRNPPGIVRAVAALPDGQRILSGGYDNTVRVWLLNGTHQNTFTLHTREVTALVALPDNQHALSGSADKTIKLFNVNDGAVLRTFKHHTNPVFSLALLPDGLRFVSGSNDDTARIAQHGLAPCRGRGY